MERETRNVSKEESECGGGGNNSGRAELGVEPNTYVMLANNEARHYSLANASDRCAVCVFQDAEEGNDDGGCYNGKVLGRAAFSLTLRLRRSAKDAAA